MGVSSVELGAQQGRLEKGTRDLFNEFIEFTGKTDLDRILKQTLVEHGITEWRVETFLGSGGSEKEDEPRVSVEWPAPNGKVRSFLIFWHPYSYGFEPSDAKSPSFSIDGRGVSSYLSDNEYKKNPQLFKKKLAKAIKVAVEKPDEYKSDYDITESLILIEDGLKRLRGH